MSRELVAHIRLAGPVGVTAAELQTSVTGAASRSSLNRRLSQLCETGEIKRQGSGRAIRYVATAPRSRAEVEAYFSLPAAARLLARFREAQLGPTPAIDPDRAARCAELQARARPMDRRHRAEFTMNFTWGSSVLEGSSYSELDTEALVLHGWRSPDKPREETILAVNHMRAADFLLSQAELSVTSICILHGLLTGHLGQAAIAASDTPAPSDKRSEKRGPAGVPDQPWSPLPSVEPGDVHHALLLESVVDAAKRLSPIEAAFYLLTRISYLRHFRGGNRRLSRIVANIPLLAAGLVPISFADVDRADYLLGLAEFDELGTTRVIEQVFIQAYVRSIIRSSEFPASMRNAGIDIELVAREMVAFVNSGKRPLAIARALVRS